MAKIWLMSDLHQEFVQTIYGRHPLTRFDPALAAPASFDVVVVCGDASVKLSEAIDWLADRFAGCKVVYVPGNHDFYNASSAQVQTLPQILAKGRERAYKRGITLLSDDTVELAGTRLIGTTLWTDFTSIGDETFEEKIRRASGRNGLSDYKVIWYPTRGSGRGIRRLQPSDTIAAHVKSRSFIVDHLNAPFAGPTLAISHHAPHPSSLDPTFGGVLDYCFASNMEQLLLSNIAPSAWFHGHIHQRRDYWVGNCRIVCNPRGYTFANGYDGLGFDPGLVVDTVDLGAATTQST